MAELAREMQVFEKKLQVQLELPPAARTACDIVGKGIAGMPSAACCLLPAVTVG